MNELSRKWAEQLTSVGLTGFDLVDESYDRDLFGNGRSTFRKDGIELVLSRDRGVEFLDVARIGPPQESFPMCELKIAMGWSAPTDEVEGDDATSVEEELCLLAAEWKRVASVFGDDEWVRTKIALRRAREAFMEANRARYARLASEMKGRGEL